ncbi:T9SS type A sorting domain-containing protein [Pontibacter sp. H249]|uniref:T9SS type A sorting domain-containing protein n=1 Tax=Pontibacter sp. H249 TaxID=3133420 RepID=UPI0030C00075
MILFQGQSSEFLTLTFNNNTETYELTSVGTVGLHNGAEAATIDMDGNNRLWIAYDGSSEHYVKWSDPPYNSWSNPITLAANVKNDDICVVTAMPGKMGVVWSNQNSKLFGFRTLEDGAHPISGWSSDESPASQTAQNFGNGMADDHINIAVGSDGTLYAAVKTSYNNGASHPVIGLLVRRPLTGKWDDLYEVSNYGTRPIVVLDEPNATLRVLFTEEEGDGNILYRETLVTDINFGNVRSNNNPPHILMEGEFNNVTSSKANFNGEIVFLASDDDNEEEVSSVLARTPVVPLPIELMSFTASIVKNNALVQWVTASETDNDYFIVEASTTGKEYIAIGTVAGSGTTHLQNKYTFVDKAISRYNAEVVYYRITQVDYSGDATRSATKAVYPSKMPETMQAKAFPNPFKNRLQVQISLVHNLKASLALSNVQGEVVYKKELELSVGENDLILPDVNVPSGLYFLTISTELETQTLKIIRE